MSNREEIKKRSVPKSDEFARKQLRVWFANKPADELADIIMSYIDHSDAEFKRWQLAMRSDNNELDAPELRKMITKALPAKQLFEWNKVARYFKQAEGMFDTIIPDIEKLPVSQQWQLIYRAIERLNKVLERIDDSGGFRFPVEARLSDKLIELFNLLTWSDEKKAKWIFDHFKEFKLDVFPAVPEDFDLTDEVNRLFVEKCREALQAPSQLLDISDWDVKWSMQRLAKPLIEEARKVGNLQEECRLRKLTATDVRDHIKISEVCLDAGSPIDAEYWLQEAYKLVKDSRDERDCREYEIKVRVALQEFEFAWSIAWQMFEQKPSFIAYTGLEKLQQQTGEIDSLFRDKVEALFAAKSVKNVADFSFDSDALLAFYLFHNEIEKAHQWIMTYVAEPQLLLKVADAIVSKYPDDAIQLYYRVVGVTIKRANNQAYRDALELLIRLDNMLIESSYVGDSFGAMIKQLAQDHKPKRNMMKLLDEYFFNYLL